MNYSAVRHLISASAGPAASHSSASRSPSVQGPGSWRYGRAGSANSEGLRLKAFRTWLLAASSRLARRMSAQSSSGCFEPLVGLQLATSTSEHLRHKQKRQRSHCGALPHRRCARLVLPCAPVGPVKPVCNSASTNKYLQITQKLIEQAANIFQLRQYLATKQRWSLVLSMS